MSDHTGPHERETPATALQERVHLLEVGAVACLAAAIIGGLAVSRMSRADRYARRPRELDWPAYPQAHETRG